MTRSERRDPPLSDVGSAVRALFTSASDESDGHSEALRSVLSSARDVVDQVRGRVALHSHGDPAALGVRSAGTLSGQQIVLAAEGLDVVLDVLDAPDGGETDGEHVVRVRGEVVDADEPLAVQLLVDGREVALSEVDEMGEFDLGDVPIGSYELVVAGSHREVLSEIRLG